MTQESRQERVPVMVQYSGPPNPPSGHYDTWQQTGESTSNGKRQQTRQSTSNGKRQQSGESTSDGKRQRTRLKSNNPTVDMLDKKRLQTSVPSKPTKCKETTTRYI